MCTFLVLSILLIGTLLNNDLRALKRRVTIILSANMLKRCEYKHTAKRNKVFVHLSRCISLISLINLQFITTITSVLNSAQHPQAFRRHFCSGGVRREKITLLFLNSLNYEINNLSREVLYLKMEVFLYFNQQDFSGIILFSNTTHGNPPKEMWLKFNFTALDSLKVLYTELV